jgi:hypothetical protein
VDDLLDGVPGIEKSDKKPTICSKCKYFNSPSDSSGAALCSNPRFAFKPEYDYVTGMIKNETRPKCGDINVDGNCPGYDKATDDVVELLCLVILYIFVALIATSVSLQYGIMWFIITVVVVVVILAYIIYIHGKHSAWW